MNAKARLATVAVLLAAARSVVACGDPAPAAASASASSPPPPCDKVELAERERRCKGSETACCTAMMRAVDRADPAYGDKLLLACGGGDETSCQAVRDGDLDPKAKVKVLDRACTRIGRWTCRTAAMLGLVATPDQAGRLVDNYCRQTDDSTFRAGGVAVSCAKPDAETIEGLVAMGGACKLGDLAACKTLGGQDGHAQRLFAAVAWRARGVPLEEAETHRVRRPVAPAADPQGAVRVRAEQGPHAAELEKQLASLDDRMRRCVGEAALAEEKARGKVVLRVRVDKTGRVAYAVVEDAGKLGDGELVTCLRASLQDLEVVPGGAEPAETRLSLDVRR